MKRRDFLIHAGMTGVIVPAIARAAVPCPPPTVSVSGGTSASTACPSGGSSQSDWTARSTAAGVIAAYGFDTAAQVTAGYLPGNNGTRGFYDTTTSTMAGGGALRFDLLAGETGANIAGSYTAANAPWMFLGHSFGQNSTFYVQYRYRLTPSMIANLASWNSYFKTSIFHQGNASCAAMELTMTDVNGAGPIVYTDCGAFSMYTDVTDPLSTQNTPLLTDSGWDLTTGPKYTDEPHAIVNQYPAYFQWPTNEWLTVYYKIHVGTLTSGGGPKDSTIEVWLQRQGGAYWQKFVSCITALEFDGTSADVYNNMTLTPYMTGLSTSASVAASVWYDELIISTQAIALPVAPNT